MSQFHQSVLLYGSTVSVMPIAIPTYHCYLVSLSPLLWKEKERETTYIGYQTCINTHAFPDCTCAILNTNSDRGGCVFSWEPLQWTVNSELGSNTRSGGYTASIIEQMSISHRSSEPATLQVTTRPGPHERRWVTRIAIHRTLQYNLWTFFYGHCFWRLHLQNH